MLVASQGSCQFYSLIICLAANGVRYPRVGGRRQRHFAGTHFQPRKQPENAQTPTRRVHAVLGCQSVKQQSSSLLFGGGAEP
jgi:hypothetical protein